MKKINLANCSIEELWKYVATELAKNDVDVILVGGAVVSIYTEGAYVSGDLDFVVNEFTRNKLNEVLSNLGFTQKTRHYTHPDCKHLYLEFASFPASIGDDTNIKPASVDVNGIKIKIFTPTDCVRDRLASYIHFKANDCLDQAAMVAQKHNINYKKVKDWCVKEGTPSAFDDLMEKIKKDN
jgi:hypothetical protein